MDSKTVGPFNGSDEAWYPFAYQHVLLELVMRVWHTGRLTNSNRVEDTACSAVAQVF